MREIKFRGKLQNGDFVFGDLIKDAKLLVPDEYASDMPCILHDEYLDEVNPDTVGQYTGLKDKNGKEIYEGDIVVSVPTGSKWKGVTMIVVFRYGSFGMHQVEADRYCSFIGHLDYAIEKEYCLPTLQYLSEEMQFVEVIGSIHDNPELLK